MDDSAQQIEELFAAALELGPADRAAFLDARCASQPRLRAELTSLLAAHERAGDFLEWNPGPRTEPADQSGRTVGGFTLVELIGRGGMGAVYRAVRADGEFTQRVAVKMIDTSLTSAETLRRFKAERQILAVLNHPHIVAFLDGGLSPDGQGYLVMEFVEGVPLSRHAAERGLPLTERLRLFQRVCAAVQYAHQHGVVHRDLKPANILVTADGMPKVLDFGIAKLLDTSGVLVDATLAGAHGALTPNYSSPEQLRGAPVTTASDLYTLGVLLYELVTGGRPYETADKPLDEVLQLVTLQDPPRPSATRCSLPYDPRVLRGDLDAIVLKAMSKEPERRYASAQELSDDIGRALDGRPVVAREPSVRYLVTRAARRHRTAVAAGGVAVTALVAALGFSLWQRHLAIVERDRAAARFSDVRQLANALVFKIDDSVARLPDSMPVQRDIVSEALTYLERLSRDSARDAGLTLEMARAYHRIGDLQGNQSLPNLGDRNGALTSYRKAIELLRPLAAQPRAPRDAVLELGRVDLAFATVARVTGERDAALAALHDATRTAEDLLRGNATADDAWRLMGSAEFTSATMTTGDESLVHWRQAGAVFARLLAQKPDDPDRERNVALVEKYLGSLSEDRGDFAAALEHHSRALELDEKRFNTQPSNRSVQFDLAIDLGGVANAHWHTGHRQEAVAEYERTLHIREGLADADPNDVLSRSRVAFVHSRLAALYGEMGHTVQALDHAREAAHLGESMAHIDVVHTELFAEDLQILADAERQNSNHAAACADYRRSLRVAGTILGEARGDPNLMAQLQHVMEWDKRVLASCSGD